MFLIKRIILLSILMIQTSFGVSIALDGTRSIISGSDCSTATYRFGTTTSYQGEDLDIILEVLSEDNDYTGGACVNTQDGVVSFHIRDGDYYENVASMDLKFTVVKKGTTTPILVDMLTVTNFDLDNSPGATLTDDVYYKNPLQTLISNDSEVLIQTNNFYNQYTVKLRGKNTGNCNDSATLTELSCRAGAIWKNSSTIFARVQNDDAYGRYSRVTYPTAHRLLQFSFEYEDIAPLINDNNETKDCGVYNYSLNSSQWTESSTHSQYNNNLNIQKTISIPDASQLKISFSGETENNYDYLYIIDENGNQHSYDGNLNTQNDLIIDGSSVTIKFTSDGSVVKEGVTVTIESLGCNENYDFGDAPTQYTHVSHKISPNLYLGNSVPDSEEDQQSSEHATSDGDDDNDGVSNLPALTVGDDSYTVPVTVFNNTGENAYITAWIDFNRNGTFEYEEALNTNNLQISSSNAPQTINVQWSNSFENQLSNLTAGKAIMRIRLTTSRILRCDDPHYKEGNGDAQDNYFVSPDGEVEDYEITIQAPIGEQFSCAEESYLTTSNDLYSLNLSNGNNNTLKMNYTTDSINAIGYNVKDNFIWGWDLTKKKVVRIDANYQTNLFETSVDVSEHDISISTKNGFTSGDVSKDGILYLAKPSLDHKLHRFDLNSGVPVYLGADTFSDQTIHFGDFAINPIDNYLYTTADKRLYRIDPSNAHIDDLGLIQGDLTAEDSGYFHSYVFDKDGNMYFYSNSNGKKIFKLDLSDFDNPSTEAEEFTTLDWVTSSGDGARCANAGMSRPTKLIADYHFDECSWNGTANEVKDSSSNNYHGISFDTQPKDEMINTSADLSKSSIGDYISLNHNAINGIEDFTISNWIKTDTTRSHAILSGANSSEDNELLAWINHSKFYPHIKGYNKEIAIPNVTDNQWHMLTWTRKADKNCIYVDGSLSGCLTGFPTGALSISSGGLILGQEQDAVGGRFDANQDFEGQIDELTIWDNVLSPAKIQEIYNNQNSGKNWDGTQRDAVICEEPQEPFVCDETLYLSNRNQLGTGNIDSGKTWLHSINREVLPYAYLPIGEGYISTDGGYNAIGYNVKDNFIYGMYKNILVKIDKNSVVKELGEVEGFPNGQLYSGEFDRDGFYYVTGTGGPDNTMYKIDIAQRKVVKTITLSQSVRFWDMAIDKSGEYFYAMLLQNGDDDSSFNNDKIAKIKISDGTITTIGNSHADLPSYIGLVFSDANGDIFMMSNEDGFYKVNTETGAMNFLSSTSNLTFYNDGTSCPDANISEPPGLSISSNVVEREGDSGTTDFTFTVSINRSSDNPMLNMMNTMGFMFTITEGTATLADDDYSAMAEVNGAFFQMGSMVPILPTTDEITITVKVKGDTKIEPDETFFVNIVSPRFIGITNGKGMGTIINDDSPQFNIERTGQDSTPSTTQEEQDAKESFYTQIAGRDFDYTIVSYAKGAGFDEFEIEDTTLKIELIDNNSSIENEVIYSFYTHLGEKASRFDIIDQDAHKLELNATRDARFKISYLESNNSVIKGLFTKEQFESNVSRIKSTMARDSFAIRPAGFVLKLRANDGDYRNFVHISTNNESVEVAAGYDYELNVTALNFKHQKSSKYFTSINKNINGQQKDVRFQEVNATLVFDDDMQCANSNNIELKNHYDFRNGIKIDNGFKHTNVGKYRVEIKDNNWTNIDHYYTTEAKRGCVVGASFISTASNQMSGCNIDSNISFNGRDYHHMKLSFEPYYFDLSHLTLSNLSSPSHPDYLYMGDLEQSEEMAVKISGEIVAKEKGGETTTNFTKECHAKELMLSLEYNGTSEQGDFNNTTFVQLKTVRDSNVNSQRTVKYNDDSVPLTEEEIAKDSSTMTIDANITISASRFTDENEGVSTIEVLYNIQKNLSEETNPIEIEFKNMKAEAKDAHSIIAWKSKVHGVEDKDEKFIPRGSDDFNSTKLFYFSRIVPDSIDYTYTLSSIIPTPISVEIYCDVNQTWCTKKRVTQGNGLNGLHSTNYWYTAIKHDSDHDGTLEIVQKDEENDFNNKLDMAETDPKILENFNKGERGRQSQLKTKYKGNNGEIPATEPVKIEMSIIPDPWLKYHSIPERHGNPYYHVIFMSVPPGSHTGVGRTGNILNIKANANANKKLDW